MHITYTCMYINSAWPNLQACELSRIALQTRAWRIVSQLCETWVFIVALCQFQTNTHTTCHQHSAEHSASIQLNSRSEKIFGKSIVFHEIVANSSWFWVHLVVKSISTLMNHHKSIERSSTLASTLAFCEHWKHSLSVRVFGAIARTLTCCALVAQSATVALVWSPWITSRVLHDAAPRYWS